MLSDRREHVKSRISKDFLHPDTLQLLTEDPPARYLLSGMLIKQAVGQLDLADIYGTLVCSRVLLPDEHHSLSSKHLRLSSQAELLQKASLPLPIYSMVRHDVTEVEQAIKDNAKKNPLHIKEGAEKEVQEKKDLMSAAAWQWFELTPYEVCHHQELQFPQ